MKALGYKKQKKPKNVAKTEKNKPEIEENGYKKIR